jgi:hypothetical protein
MHLSPVYLNRFKWIMVYHTRTDSEEVEMMGGDNFFDTEKLAWDWFHEKYRIHHFIQPEALRIRLGDLTITRVET